jgi:hypothetical protein
MKPEDQITYLQSEKEKKLSEIADKEKNIELLKEGIKIDKKLIKAYSEGIAMYEKQISNANSEQKKG